MNKFFEDLREHATEIISFEKKRKSCRWQTMRMNHTSVRQSVTNTKKIMMNNDDDDDNDEQNYQKVSDPWY